MAASPDTENSIPNEYLRRHPVAAAGQIEDLPDKALGDALHGVDSAALIIAMEYLSPVKALTVFSLLPHSQQLEVLDQAPPRLAVTLLTQLADADRDSLLAELRPVSRDDLTRLLSFPEDSAGRLMSTTFVTAQADMTVEQALKRLQQSAIRGVRSLFVVTGDGRLDGRVDIQDLALAVPEETLATLMAPVQEAVGTRTNREELVELLDRSRQDSVPVVDADGRLMGVVRYRSLFHAIEDVATADLQKMVGVSPEERALSTPGFAIRRRLPWLHINLLTAFLAAFVVGLFENLIAQFTALAILLPVVAGQSGNAGAQALAVTMRGLFLREVGIRQWRSVLGKEVAVGLVNGLVLAVTCGLAVFVWSSSVGLALVIGLAMIMSMLAAGIAGSLVPIILTRLGQDPATASSIILTTITDVAGFFSFLGTALLLSFML
ncbi:MAG: magnesium transporter [Thiohalophilus sp.]|uniref:magnesium transporter n=1 Tax=Thiohalophilus sp. TaxID=3028392 RepID=UPI0028704161|nr:magnesium transporter [Thiohalophilus sp.]MDR9437084.1 magnesium transporter [Thiohalophilus sp.]